MLKLLLFSTLYPNAAQPIHGPFVERRLLKLLATGACEARVIAPVPWFPSGSQRFGKYADFARVPASEQRNGVDVMHPRYPVIPKIGMNLAPLLLALAAWPAVRDLIAGGYDFDVIDAHYYYPDGVAAALLGRWSKKPVTITARGTDINLIPEYPFPRRLIRWASRQSAASIAVCEALKKEMVELGMEAEQIHVLRNGVDLDHFRPIDPAEARRLLGLQETRWMLSVGLLIERKGHDIPIRALVDLPGWSLLVAGDGPLRGELQRLAESLGVADRVRFLGSVPQAELPSYYSAADVLVLASSREGWANVLLESMACGTPVIASSVWGTPEVVATEDAGVLMAERTPAGLLTALAELQRRRPSRERTRAYAEQFDWAPTTQGQLQIFERLAGRAA